MSINSKLSINNLPNEVIVHFLKYLAETDRQALLNFGLCSKNCNELVTEVFKRCLTRLRPHSALASAYQVEQLKDVKEMTRGEVISRFEAIRDNLIKIYELNVPWLPITPAQHDDIKSQAQDEALGRIWPLVQRALSREPSAMSAADIRNWLQAPENAERLSSLTKLNLSKLSLPLLPEEIGQFTNLQELDLNNNQIAALPDTICQLTNLQNLNLWMNQITTLPDTIGQLANLQKFSLEKNQITTLPDTIGQLTNLRELCLGNNQITTLPDTIGQLTNLEKLYLDRNKITALPDSIGELLVLYLLTLSDNQIAALPDLMRQLEELKVLSLTNNKIRGLPRSLRHLRKCAIF